MRHSVRAALAGLICALWVAPAHAEQFVRGPGRPAAVAGVGGFIGAGHGRGFLPLAAIEPHTQCRHARRLSEPRATGFKVRYSLRDPLREHSYHSGWVAECEARHASFNPHTRTYIDADGGERRCE